MIHYMQAGEKLKKIVNISFVYAYMYVWMYIWKEKTRCLEK